MESSLSSSLVRAAAFHQIAYLIVIKALASIAKDPLKAPPPGLLPFSLPASLCIVNRMEQSRKAGWLVP